MTPTLTVGMACHNDIEGVYFSVQALRMYHSDVVPELEIVVVDNDPDGAQGRQTRDFLAAWVREARYVPHREVVGTAASKNRVFAEARGEFVLVIDCHVMLAPGSLRRLIDFYRARPETTDLLQGPLWMDDLHGLATHLDPVWRGEMYGIWGADESLVRDIPDLEPREIGMHGMGVFSSRRDAWLGFNPRMAGFGGEEGYIHQKYRNSGRKTLLLPFLKWVHRFCRANPVPYPCTRYHKIRNYLIGWEEVNLPLGDVIDHFRPVTPAAELEAAIRDSGVNLTGRAK